MFAANFSRRVPAALFFLAMCQGTVWGQTCPAPQKANGGQSTALERAINELQNTFGELAGLWSLSGPPAVWWAWAPYYTPPFLTELTNAVESAGDLCIQGLKSIGLGGLVGAQERPRAAAGTGASRVTGHASEAILVADFLGNGTPVSVYLGSNGVVVQVRNTNGAVQSTNQFPTGFSPDPAYTTLAAADFNGDGKLDLAVSDAGEPGSTAGGVAILLGNGDGTFRPAQYFPAGQNPSSIAAADFNGDGKIDVAAASSVGASIVVLSGNGDGTFGAPVSYAAGGDSQATPVSIFALDLNGDGKPDLAVANQGFVTVPNSSISTLLNTGSGFRAAFNYPLPLALLPDYLAYSDLNNDGKVDLVAVSSQASAAMTMFGNGDGTFQAPSVNALGIFAGSVAVLPQADGTSVLFSPGGVYPGMWFTTVSAQGVLGSPTFYSVGGAPTGLAMADLNGDGQLDAVVTGGSSDVSVLLAQNGQFQTPVGYSLAQPSPMPQAAAAGDMNNDGKPDIVVASAGQPGEPGAVSVLLGNGDGTLKTPVNTQVNQNAQSIALADFNGDGKLDAVVAAYGSQPGAGSDAGGVVVLLGQGDGTFQPPELLTVNGLHPEAVTAADVNGDGIPDIAAVMVSTVNLGTSTLAVFLGKGDGTFQSARTFPLQSTAYYMAAIVTGDWNGDGKLDIAAVTGSDNTSIQILLGDGTGNFNEMSTLPSTEDEPVYLVSADLNRDGKPDLVVAHCCGQGDATYLFGNGDGTFQPEYELLTGNSPAAVAVTATGATATIVSALNGGAALTAVGLEATSPALSMNVSAASSSVTSIAPASIATIYGANLATGTASPASGNPTSLQGTTVSLNDASDAQQTAPLFYVSPGQINYLVPAGTALGPAAATVSNGSGLQGSVSAQVANVAPGIFQLNASGLAAAIVLIVGSSGAQSFANVYQVGASNSILAQPIDLSAGQVYLELYGTGIRNASSVSLTVGGRSVPVLSSGAQGTYPGLDQVNIGPLPLTLAGQGQATISLTADGQTANAVNVTFK